MPCYSAICGSCSIGRLRPGETEHPAQRAELEGRSAAVIRRLALSDAISRPLPDNYATAAPDPDLPQGRQKTVEYLNSLRDFEGALVYLQGLWRTPE